VATVATSVYNLQHSRNSREPSFHDTAPTQAGFAKIKDEREIKLCGLQVGERLRDVNVRDSAHAFEFEDDSGDQQIQAVAADHRVFVEDVDGNLGVDGEIPDGQLLQQRLLVDRLQKSGTEDAMDFHCRADDLVFETVFFHGWKWAIGGPLMASIPLTR